MPQYLRNPWMQSRRPFYPPIPARIVYGYDGIMGQGWIVGHTVAPFHSTVSPAVFMPSETQDQPSIQGGKPSLSPDHQAKRKGPVAEGTISYLDEPNPPEVMYIYTMEQANAWAKETRSQVLGFDVEWKVYGPNQGQISVVQLCDGGRIGVFHLRRLSHFPKGLKFLLESKRIAKVGCRIRGDATRLLKSYGVASSSLLELGALAPQVSPHFPNRLRTSLQELTRNLLGKEVEKARDTRCGNWEAHRLTPYQLHYAANDAWVRKDGRPKAWVMEIKAQVEDHFSLTPTDTIASKVKEAIQCPKVITFLIFLFFFPLFLTFLFFLIILFPLFLTISPYNHFCEKTSSCLDKLR
ncbi:MAG: ribonuclease H-like domain-containing protein [Piptocephalis tieghemiana]|nr:MAG: ribonuclease H-like domain-containing protein [Piptocephalis tieghemiana]